MILYFPWWQEEDLLKCVESYEEKFKKVFQQIKDTIKWYEPCREEVGNVLDEYDENVIPQHTWDEMAGEREQENLGEDSIRMDDEYRHRDTSLVDILPEGEKIE